MPPLSHSKSDMSDSTLIDFETWRQYKPTEILPLLEQMLAETRYLRANFLKIRKVSGPAKTSFRKGRGRLLVAAKRDESERYNAEAASKITEELGHLFGLIKKYRSEFDRLDSSLNDLIQRNDTTLTQLAVALYRVQSCLCLFRDRFDDDVPANGWPLPRVPREQFESSMNEFQQGVDIVSDFLDTLDVLENRSPELETPPSPRILRGRSTWPAIQDYATQQPVVEFGPWLAGIPSVRQNEEERTLSELATAIKPEPDILGGSAPRKRLVFLATRRLDQSEISKRVDEKVEEEQGPTSIEDYLTTQRQNPVDTFSHWAVYVWDKDDAFSGTLFELRQESSTSKPVQLPGTVLRKKVNGSLRWSLRPFRHTLLSDETIFGYAKAVIAKYGENYDFASANCQVFANTLTQCIAQPIRREHVFQGIRLLPHAHAGPIFKRRCQEWVDVKAEFGPSTMLFTDISTPVAVGIFLDVIIPPVMMLLIICAFMEYAFSEAIWRLLILTLAIGSMLPYSRGPIRFYGHLMQDVGKTWQNFRDPILRRQEEERVQEDFIRDTITKDVKDIDIGEIQSKFAASRQTQLFFRT